MAKTKLWQLMVLLFAFIGCSKCSMCSTSLECPMSGAFFGGRLVLMDGGGPNSALFSPLVGRGHRIIFQTPPAHLRLHMGSGRGQMWIGGRNCQASDSEPGYCPWTGDRPCLDKGIPCETEPPTYSQSNPLEFSEVSGDSITVSWPAWDETTGSGVGPITGYKILYQQLDGIFQEILLDRNSLSHRFEGLKARTTYQFQIVLVRDGEPTEGQPSIMQSAITKCGELTDVNLRVDMRLVSATGNFRMNVTWQLPSVTRDCKVTFQKLTFHQLDKDSCEFQASPKMFEMELDRRSRSFKRLPPNTRYNITLLVRQLERIHVTSQVVRTLNAEPGAPGGLQGTEKTNRIDLSWDPLPCGKRNGEFQRYEYVAFRNQQEFPGEKQGTRHSIRRVSVGDKWRFKVRACNEDYCGPYAEVNGVM